MRSPEAVRDDKAYHDAPPHPAPAACVVWIDVKVAPKATHAAIAAFANFLVVNKLPLRQITLALGEHGACPDEKWRKQASTFKQLLGFTNDGSRLIFFKI